MLDIGRCPECNVPEPFYQGHEWLNNGDIVQKADHRARMGIIECEALDPLFTNVGDIIGTSIYPLIINIAARGSKFYLDNLIPKEVKEMVQSKTMDLRPLAEPIFTMCHIMGFGQYDFLDYRYEKDPGDFARCNIYRPFSVPEVFGCYSGGVSAMVGGEHSVSYEEISPGLYEVVANGQSSRISSKKKCVSITIATKMETSSSSDAAPAVAQRLSPATIGTWLRAS